MAAPGGADAAVGDAWRGSARSAATGSRALVGAFDWNMCSSIRLPTGPRQAFRGAVGDNEGMPSLLERLNADLKDAMRAGDATRRDEIRGLIAMLKAEHQSKLTRTLARQGLILQGDNATLSPEQQAAVDHIRATTALSADEE